MLKNSRFHCKGWVDSVHSLWMRTIEWTASVIQLVGAVVRGKVRMPIHSANGVGILRRAKNLTSVVICVLKHREHHLHTIMMGRGSERVIHKGQVFYIQESTCILQACIVAPIFSRVSIIFLCAFSPKVVDYLL